MGHSSGQNAWGKPATSAQAAQAGSSGRIVEGYVQFITVHSYNTHQSHVFWGPAKNVEGR